MNVGQLREALKDVSDSVPVVVPGNEDWRMTNYYYPADCTLKKGIQYERGGTITEMIGKEKSYEDHLVIPIVVIN